jgi:regulator of protease activity HflC (stomatin/prohibitin superfamily)
MILTIRIRKHERGLWFRHGDFLRLVGPGRHWIWSRLWSRGRDRVDVVSTLNTKFEHPMLEVLVKEPSLREHLEVVELRDDERALIWKDERLAAIVGPGRHAFWNSPAKLRVEIFNVNTVRFEHERLEMILTHAEASKWFNGVIVEAHEEALLYRNGRMIDRLEEGRHIFWRGAGQITWKAVDRREQTADVAGQEIMSSDKVTLRVNLIVTYQVVDAVAAVTTVSDFAQSLYREAQLALRAAVGTRTLDALLADKESIGGEVRETLTRRAAEFGVSVRSVGLRDIILPGEMKTILNQVITAEKEAQANLIKRREETAAARSQANTARLLAENPVLLRMKELEAVQGILADKKATFIFGSQDVAEQIRGLVSRPEPQTS